MVETTLLPDGMVSIFFEMGEYPLVYRDAIVIPEGSMTAEEIQAEMQTRYTAWLAAVNPPEDVNNG